MIIFIDNFIYASSILKIKERFSYGKNNLIITITISVLCEYVDI